MKEHSSGITPERQKSQHKQRKSGEQRKKRKRRRGRRGRGSRRRRRGEVAGETESHREERGVQVAGRATRSSPQSRG